MSVWPKELCKGYPTRETKDSNPKVTYSGAGSTSKPIVNEGERRIRLDMDGDVFGCRVQVAAVRKPLLSVSEMCDAGHDVHFFHTGEAYCVHRETSKVVKLKRRKGVFEVEAVLPPFPGGSQAASRVRPTNAEPGLAVPTWGGVDVKELNPVDEVGGRPRGPP